MNPGHKHFSKWGCGEIVWHKMTQDKGMVIGIVIRHQCPPSYICVFEDNRNEITCLEIELTDEQPTILEPEKS